MKTNIILFSAIILFFFPSNTLSQIDGWSEPVLVDSARDLGSPLITVSPKGQIAVMTFNLLYISDDNGKSFQLRYTFVPPLNITGVFPQMGWHTIPIRYCGFTGHGMNAAMINVHSPGK